MATMSMISLAQNVNSLICEAIFKLSESRANL